MTFHQHSKQIVEDYLGTVAYVDDLIFSNRKVTNPANLGKPDMRVVSAENATPERVEKEIDQEIELQIVPNIDPLVFTNAFLEKGIHCALLELTNEEDSLEPIKKILKKSDIIILDWQMHHDLGRRANELLISALKEPDAPELRLIIIFTNDPKYNTILPEKIIPELEKINIKNIKIYDTGCCISFGHTKIVVLIKENGVKTNYSVSDEELPDRIIEEFTEFTEGLVSNTALNAVTLIRRNTHTLLGVFNKNLDHAYLAHRAMLPVPEDAEALLRSSIVDSINSVLSYSNIDSTCNFEQIGKWFGDNKYGDKEIVIGKNTNKVTINDEDRKEWLEIGYKSFISLILERNSKGKLSEEQIDDYDKKNLLQATLDCFIPKNSNSSEDFAILTHHKCNFISPPYTPQLTLGVIVKRYHEYFLCIQQRCDSVRLKTNCARKFLFLPLEETEKRFSIIYKNLENKYVKLKVKNSNSYNLETFFFFATKNGSVFAKKDWGVYKFFDSQKRWYIWILDLNDSHAQKIVNEYSANLSRVGLDESEWLRRS